MWLLPVSSLILRLKINQHFSPCQSAKGWRRAESGCDIDGAVCGGSYFILSQAKKRRRGEGGGGGESTVCLPESLAAHFSAMQDGRSGQDDVSPPCRKESSARNTRLLLQQNIVREKSWRNTSVTPPSNR